MFSFLIEKRGKSKKEAIRIAFEALSVEVDLTNKREYTIERGKEKQSHLYLNKEDMTQNIILPSPRNEIKSPIFIQAQWKDERSFNNPRIVKGKKQQQYETDLIDEPENTNEFVISSKNEELDDDDPNIFSYNLFHDQIFPLKRDTISEFKENELQFSSPSELVVFEQTESINSLTYKNYKIGYNAELAFFVYLKGELGESITESNWVSFNCTKFFHSAKNKQDNLGYDFCFVDHQNKFAPYPSYPRSPKCFVEVKKK